MTDSAQFACCQGHGIWRRDQLPIRRGSLVCPIGLRSGEICGLTNKRGKVTHVYVPVSEVTNDGQ